MQKLPRSKTKRKHPLNPRPPLHDLNSVLKRSRVLPESKEFDFIGNLLGHRLKLGGDSPGDDAYIIKKGKDIELFASDASFEGTHFNLDWTTPEKALQKCLLSNLSDCNAMGGFGTHWLLNLGVPSHWRSLIGRKMNRVVSKWEKEQKLKLIGGDFCRTNSGACFSIAIMGKILGKPLLRCNARVGHKIYVSGSLGTSAAGLHILSQKGPEEVKYRSKLVKSHLTPSPPLKLGPKLSSTGKKVAAIDISDGLSSELHHLSIQSAVSLTIHWNQLPIDRRIKQKGFSSHLKDFVLNGGEEYQLLFTGNFSKRELTRFQAICPVTEIGEVNHGRGVWLQNENGVTEELQAKGYCH